MIINLLIARSLSTLFSLTSPIPSLPLPAYAIDSIIPKVFNNKVSYAAYLFKALNKVLIKIDKFKNNLNVLY